MQRLGVTLLALCLAAPAAAEPRVVEYLHIEANEGGSSGGHVALRFGDETFHFQQEGAGLIRMRRDDTPLFNVRYALLGNRAIHATRIAVSDETYARLHDGFTRRLLVQDAQYDRLAALDGDVALLELWRRRSTEPSPSVSVPIRAAAYFLADGFAAVPPQPDGSPAIEDVRAGVAAAHGSDFLTGRIAALRASLAGWQPRAVRDPGPALRRDASPAFAATASVDYTARLEALTALEVLASAPNVRPDALRVATDLAPLDAHERAVLSAFAAELRQRLVALAASSRPDFGYPLLLGLGRLAAVDAALACGRLVVLDRFPVDAPDALLPSGAADRAEYLAAAGGELRSAAAHLRAQLLAVEPLREADYTLIETTTNRLLEIEGGRRGRRIRQDNAAPLPARAARRAELVAPPLDADDVERELTLARRAAAAYRAALGELYGYDLFARNCVSEIFATIDAALAGADAPREASAAASRRQLGGVVETDGTLNFIPVVSAAAVARNYAVVGHDTEPSYRERRLRALADTAAPWHVALREATTLTATSYHPSPMDSAFLLFTDQTVALRPLAGAVNLMVGIADGAAGLMTWPIDHGRRLSAGFRGAFFSLPELAFVNIRKGSMAWIEPELLPAPADE